MARQLTLINRKLDVLGTQVQHLYERTVALEELKDELVPIARDAIAALGQELQAVEHEFNSEEVVELLRKMLRNTPTLIRTLDRLESADSLLTELEPLGKEVVRDLIERLQVLEETGYFRLLRGLVTVLDGIVRQTTPADIERLAQNVDGIAGTLKRLTKPAFGIKVDAALAVLAGEGEEPKPMGAFGMWRASRNPEVQRGLGLLLEMARALGNPQTSQLSPPNKSPTTDQE